MSDAIKYTSSLTERKRINTCRLYLNVTFLSDIFNILGTSIIHGVLIGNKSSIPKSTLE